VSLRLDWRVGTGEGETVLAATPERVLPQRSRRALARRPGFLLLYVAALAVAGWLGFGIGRWAEAREAVVEEVNRQVFLETLANRRGDMALLAKTLDPAAPAVWRHEMLVPVSYGGVPDFAVTINGIQLVAPDQLVVNVTILSDLGSRTEVRAYRAVGPTWYRTVPEGWGPAPAVENVDPSRK
jgi:hypothetical protein